MSFPVTSFCPLTPSSSLASPGNILYTRVTTATACLPDTPGWKQVLHSCRLVLVAVRRLFAPYLCLDSLESGLAWPWPVLHGILHTCPAVHLLLQSKVGIILK